MTHWIPSVRPRTAIVAALLLAAAFAAGVPAAAYLGEGSAAGFVRLAYSPLCHQIPDRSLHIDGFPMAVCSRCTGLYLGGIVGLFLAAMTFSRDRAIPRPVLLAACIPSVLDWIVPWFGFHGLPDVPRLLIAIPAGAVLGWLLAIGVADLARTTSSPAGHPFGSRLSDPDFQTQENSDE